MKINQIISETTTSGAIAPVAGVLGATQTRGNPSIYGGKKVGNLLKGKKTNKPFANSVNESKMKDLSYDMETMKPAEFQKKYGKTREQMKASPINKPQNTVPPVNEADLQEDDVILVPGKGIKVKPGFHKIDPDRAEHEGETLKNSLHTIVRVASHLNKELSTRDNFPEWVSEKIGATKSMIVSVMDYLISAKEMQGVAEGFNPASQDYSDWLSITRKETMRSGETDGANSLEIMANNCDDPTDVIRNILAYVKQNRQELGREVSEETGKTVKDAIIDIKRKYPQQYQAAQQPQGVAEGEKVDRMVKHIAKSEKKLGHSKKEAENIAWATANKRGMLDNKNKKK